MLQRKKDPCNLCIVKSCCEKRETECQPYSEWKHRYDWLRKLTMALCIIPLFVITLLVGIACSTADPEMMDPDY